MMGLRYHNSVIMADLLMHDTVGHTLWCAIEFILNILPFIV